jgi:hypothetical protein
MKYCIFCAEELPDDANFCSRCGKPQNAAPPEKTPEQVKADMVKEMLGDDIKKYQEHCERHKLKPASSLPDDEDKVMSEYMAGHLNGDEFIKKASKLGMSKEMSSLFSVLDHKSETENGIIKTIKIKRGEIVYVNYRAVEIETDSGHIRSIPIKRNGIVKEICVSDGQKIQKSDVLFKVFVPVGGYNAKQ